jgi:hypothetical protein
LALEPITRIVVIDETRGTVLEQHLYDFRGVRIASAKLSKHQHDQASSVTMPRIVEIDWPATQFKITIDLADLQINQPSGDPRQLFARPQYPSYHDVDLAEPGIEPAMPQPPAGGFPTAASPGGGWSPGPGSAAMPVGSAPPAGSPPGVATGQGWTSPQGSASAPPGSVSMPPGSASMPPGSWTAPGNPYPLVPYSAPASVTPLAPGYQPAAPVTATLPTYAAPRGR